MAGILYVIATPIGNLGDITRRAADILCTVQTIACEDTRRTRVLLDHLGAEGARLTAYHEHSSDAVTAGFIERLLAGNDMALVSDAGTPLVSDPGFELLRAASAAGIRVTPVPGPSAVTAALSVCPLPTNHYCFSGFLPVKDKARGERLQQLLDLEAASVLYEAPHRLAATLAQLAQLAPDRRLFVARELTKHYESLYLGTAGEVARTLLADDAYRGEFVLIIEGSAAPLLNNMRQTLALLCEELPPAKAARITAKLTGGNRQELYRLALNYSDG